MQKIHLWLLAAMCSIPTSAWAAQTIHASGFLRPFVLICVVLLFVIVIIWALKYWKDDIPAPINKVVTFAVILIALIIIIVILLGLAGIHVT